MPSPEGNPSLRDIPLWRTPRARSLLALGALALVGGAAALAASAYTDLLWFRELGQEQVFWASLKWRILGSGIPALGTASVLLLNFAAVERVMADRPSLRPYRRLAYPIVAVAGGLISSEWRVDGAWQPLALWAGRRDFGVADPLFHRDVSYFVFSLPLYRLVDRWLLDTFAMAAVTTVAAYLAAGGVRIARPLVVLRAARGHLLFLAGLALAALAWRYQLEQFALALPHDGSGLPGAGYTDVHVRLPARRALSLLSLAGAGLCLYAAWRRVLVVPAAVVSVPAALALVGQSALPPLFDTLEVSPQQLSRETRYVADAIVSTRRAYELDRVDVRPLTPRGRLSERVIADSRGTLENMPLWDSGVLRPALNELQSVGRYYGFPSSTLDLYTIDGAPRLLAVAARHLNRAGLGPDARSWATDRFAYTHGYGVVAVDAGRTDADGNPRFAHGEFASGARPLRVEQPRVYYGEQRDAEPPYIVANTGRAEVDEPMPGSRRPDYHYDGQGGIALSNPLRRAAFAIRFGDLKLALSETVDDRSRLVLHRDVRERVRMLAPFLQWPRDPQTVIVDGRVEFLIHGYTTSSDYPYSALTRVGGRHVNYVRAPVVASVDAFTGSVRLYIADGRDPIVRAWQSIFPGLFLPGSRMPSALREHLRYPRALFRAQAAAYASYHSVDPVGFWNGADAWQQPLQIAGPIEGAGEIHFPDPERRVDADEVREHRVAPSRWRVDPQYLFARLPGDDRERLVLATPFSPRGRENLAAYLAGAIDDRGRPRLTALSLARNRLTLGPTQATRQILASPSVNQRLELLNRESRDLGRAAVNRTILGAPRLLPIGDTLVHIQPIYLVASGSGVPRVQLVTAYADGRVSYGRNVETALRRIIGG